MKKILVVEDDSNLREMYATWFKGGGYHVETANDGLEALECLQRDKPDLVFTDVQMPGMNGFGLVRFLAERRYDIPVVAISGRMFDFRGYFVDYSPGIACLQKPCSMSNAYRTVERMLAAK